MWSNVATAVFFFVNNKVVLSSTDLAFFGTGGRSSHDF